METVSQNERILVKDGEATFDAYTSTARSLAAIANRFVDYYNEKADEIGLDKMTKGQFISLYDSSVLRALEIEIDAIVEKTPAPVRKLYRDSYYTALSEMETKLEEVRRDFRRGRNSIVECPSNLTDPDALPFKGGKFEVTEEWLESIRDQFNTYATEPVSIELLKRYRAMYEAFRDFRAFTKDNNIRLAWEGDIYRLFGMGPMQHLPSFIPEKVLPLK